MKLRPYSYKRTRKSDQNHRIGERLMW